LNVDTIVDAPELRVCTQLALVDKPSFPDDRDGQALGAWDDPLEP